MDDRFDVCIDESENMQSSVFRSFRETKRNRNFVKTIAKNEGKVIRFDTTENRRNYISDHFAE
jgi:hypothetical protein